MRVFLTIAASLLASQVALTEAAAPVFNRITPTAVQQGQQVEVSVTGQRIADLVDIVTNDGGISLVEVKPPEKNADRSCKLVLKVDQDAQLGLHAIRLRTKTGLSQLRNLHVTALPVVAEKEEKKGFADAQPIEMNSAVVGRVDREDVDYFKVSLKKGQRVSAEVVGTRLGNSSGDRYFDPYLALLDSKRFELVVSDDEPLTKNDPYFSVVAPEDGDYTIELRDSAYNGDGNSHYVLHVGTFPRPSSVSPLGGQPGKTIELTLFGDPAGEKKVKVTLPEVVGDFQYFVADEQGVSPTPHLLQVSSLPVMAEVEPNGDVYNQGLPVVMPAALHGVIGEVNDYDCFQFEAKKGQRFLFQAIARTARSPLDPVLQMFDVKAKKYLAGADDTGNNPDGRLEFRAPHDGTFGIRIYDHLKRGGPEYTYRIEADMQRPTLSGDVVEFLRYFQPRWEVPVAGGIGRRISMSKRSVSGNIELDFSNLPAGVRVELPEVWAGSSQVPVVLYANDDAAIGHTFTKMGVHKAGDKSIAGVISQKILQVRWRNNDRVIQRKFEELPVVVTQKSPFRVWIEEPNTPAVPGGWLDLTVRCERAEGFENEVRIEMLMNPPGCSTSRSLKFAKGKDTVTMRVTAGDKARPGRWDVCVRAWGEHNGQVETCSSFVPMVVKERWVDFKFNQAAVEQGQSTQILVDVTGNEEFAGEATVKLLGLPPKTKAEPVVMKPGDKQLSFTVLTEAGAPPGTHKSVYCIAEVPIQVGVEMVPATEPEMKTVKVAFIEGDADTAPAEPTASDEKTAEPAVKPVPEPEAKPAPKMVEKPIFKVVPHQFRGGRLRIDKPLPKKKEPAKKPVEKKPAVKKPAVAKPLSRLEQLRQAKSN